MQCARQFVPCLGVTDLYYVVAYDFSSACVYVGYHDKDYLIFFFENQMTITPNLIEIGAPVRATQ